MTAHIITLPSLNYAQRLVLTGITGHFMVPHEEFLNDLTRRIRQQHPEAPPLSLADIDHPEARASVATWYQEDLLAMLPSDVVAYGPNPQPEVMRCAESHNVSAHEGDKCSDKCSDQERDEQSN